MTPLTKVCNKCGIEKSLDQFHKNKNYRLGVTAQCKICRSADIKRWKEANPEKVQAINARYRKTDKCKAMWKRQHAKYRDKRIAYCRKWYAEHPEKNAQYNFKNSLKKFGLTLQDYEALVARQGNVCAICRQPEANGHRLHIDHCHNTGVVRGLLCEKHNLMVGLSNDQPEILLAAAEYLKWNLTAK